MSLTKNHTYSVSEVTWYIQRLLESDKVLQNIRISGEISNWKQHSSGHIYFVLKDQQTQMTCVMFRSRASRCRQLPAEGDTVTLRGNVTVYPARGNYQIIVEDIELEGGQGDLYKEFMLLKARLEDEGLFDSFHKKALPKFPESIGVVTSPTGAVIKDICNTIARRYPHVHIILSPAVVQGENAPASICRALDKLERRDDIDVVILARGGGSLEDLWCFNDEKVARKIFGMKKPVISAVGHETDFTIADFVADVRASTPTAAAELAVPEEKQIRRELDQADQSLQRQLLYFIEFRRQLVDDYENRLKKTFEKQVTAARHELDKLELGMQALDIRKTLERGYSILYKDAQIVTSVDEVEDGDKIDAVTRDGKIHTRVIKKEKL